MNKVITNECSYLSKVLFKSISDYKKCLDLFSRNLEDAINLKSPNSIFLDANVLLRYYNISFLAREKLFEFINTNKKRIYLTSQVQFEFLRNREDIIQRFFEQVTNNIPKEFTSDILNKMKNFLDQHKVVLKDYPFIEEELPKTKSGLEELLKKLNEEVEKKRKDHKSLILKDKLLDLLSDCNSVEQLEKDELELVTKDFDSLYQKYKSDIDSSSNSGKNIFPGMGDIKEKPDDPYGDFIIYHEILKYMKGKKEDVIFLTFDNAKGDWMSKKGDPHLHYVQNSHRNTEKIMYIIDAERSLKKILDVDITPLVKTNISFPASSFNATVSGWNHVDLDVKKPLNEHIVFYLDVILSNVDQRFVAYYLILTSEGQNFWMAFTNKGKEYTDKNVEHGRVYESERDNKSCYTITENVWRRIHESGLRFVGRPMMIEKVRFRGDDNFPEEIDFLCYFKDNPITVL